MKLRDYQREAVDAVFKYWERAPSTPEQPASPLVVMPTGSGKSLVLAETTRTLVQDYGATVLIATHRAELITQDAKAIRSVWPMAPMGIYSASLKRKELGQPITVAGVQSIARVAKRLPHTDVLIVDEAHLIPPTSSEQYGKLIEALREKNPDMRIIGYTATPYRLGQGLLTQGDGALFTAVAHDVPIRRLIEEGYLAPVVTGFASAKIDVSDVSVTAGEYNLQELSKATDTDKINAAVADDVARALFEGRTSAIVFGVDIEHAARMRNELRMRGVSCETIVGSTPREERDRIIGRFKARQLQCITSCDVLTTGFDAPVTDVVALVRATLSPSLYVQIVGRGTRTAEGKTDCLLLDYGGNIDRHGPIDAVTVKEKARFKIPGVPPVKTCPECKAQVFAGVSVCSHCDFAFPPPEVAPLRETASDRAALSFLDEQDKPRKLPVGKVRWHRHKSRKDDTRHATLRIDYIKPGGDEYSRHSITASEWLCFDHPADSFARLKAERWWEHNVGCRVPTSVADAIELLDAGYMAPVVQVTVKKDGEFDRVLHVLQVMKDKDADEMAADVDVASRFADDDLPF